MSNTTVNVLVKNVPITCFLSQVYDPDTDGTSSSAEGKYVLVAGSIVIDDTTDAEQGVAYYVSYVDPTTYKHTLKPMRYLAQVEDTDISILSYGNDKYFLFFDDRVKPTLLNVSQTLVVFGAVAEYRLVRTNNSGTEECVSMYVDADGVVRGDRIPMTDMESINNAKMPTNCHTTFTITEGEAITLQMYDAAGVECAVVTLIARRAVLLNDLASTSDPIVKFDAECLQMSGEDFYIYKQQDVDHLNIQPYLIYADGSRQDLTIDNSQTFLLGIEDFIPSFPGYRQPLVLKYFLSAREIATDATVVGNVRMMTCTKNLIVVANNTSYNCKITAIPQWNNATSSYDLKLYMYTDARDRVYDVTDLFEIVEDTSYDGSLFGQQQHVVFRGDVSSYFGTTDPIIHTQDLYITLKPYSLYERYVIKDSATDEYAYGVDVSLHRRPVIHYDEDSLMYFIPTTIFLTMASFLEEFYYRSHPMFHALTEAGPEVPTHFTVRDANTGQMVISAPIEVEQYGQTWNIILTGTRDQLVGNTVIVEFLLASGDDYQLLQGVPVDIYSSQTLLRGGYNTSASDDIY